MKDLIKFSNGEAYLEPKTLNAFVEFEKKAKAIKEAEDKLKQAILSEMEAKGVIKVDCDRLLISYVAPTDRETLDTKALKKELPKIYDEYVKISPVKSSIRIKVK